MGFPRLQAREDVNTVSVGPSVELLRYQSPILMTLKSELVVDPVSPVDVAQTEQNDVAMV